MASTKDSLQSISTAVTTSIARAKDTVGENQPFINRNFLDLLECILIESESIEFTPHIHKGIMYFFVSQSHNLVSNPEALDYAYKIITLSNSANKDISLPSIEIFTNHITMLNIVYNVRIATEKYPLLAAKRCSLTQDGIFPYACVGITPRSHDLFDTIQCNYGLNSLFVRDAITHSVNVIRSNIPKLAGILEPSPPIETTPRKRSPRSHALQKRKGSMNLVDMMRTKPTEETAIGR